MKTIKIALPVLAIAAIITIYSTGAFIPETQGIEDTVAGLVVLGDAEMAQQVGGPEEGWAELVVWEGSEKASCYGSHSCGEKPPCPKDRQVRDASQHKCRSCDSQTWYYTKYRYKSKPKRIVSWCKNQSEGCFYDEAADPESDWISSCEEFVASMCDSDAGSD